MNKFIHEDFLLTNQTAVILYNNYAKPLPIIDFHNHLLPKAIAEDRKFDSIAQLWLEGDHYKWRAMRACGINEQYITGDSSDWEKFRCWSSTVPKILRGPLYHWTQLELYRYFGIHQLLNEKNAREIFDACNEKLTSPAYSTRNLLRMMNVEYLCSIEDPVDSLFWHQKIQRDFEITVSAAFRADKVLNISNGKVFTDYIKNLSEVFGEEIRSYKKLCEALAARHDFFNNAGTRMSDIALDWFKFLPVSDTEADRILRTVLQHESITAGEIDSFRTSILTFLCELNFEKKWIQQFHLGALRNINTQAMIKFGEASGFDAMNDVSYIAELGKFLNILQLNGTLAKSIFFNLNPRDNAALLTLIQCFNDGETTGKMQYGPSWWFLDQKDAIEQNIKDVSAFSILGNFIGMITDSRSFLSFSRHEYFRRILCNLLGKDAENGIIPKDNALLKNLIENICYYNAKKFLNLPYSPGRPAVTEDEI